MRSEGPSATRRRVLAIGSTVGGLALAGCTEGGDGDDGPPSAEFSFAFHPESNEYSVTHEGGDTFDEDNTGILAVDEFDGDRRFSRRFWFTSEPEAAIAPGDTLRHRSYSLEVPSRLAVIWAPPRRAGPRHERTIASGVPERE